MAKNIKVWFDEEADFLEVTFEEAPGYMRETDRDEVMARVAMDGRVIGFQILGVSRLKGPPLEASLVA